MKLTDRHIFVWKLKIPAGGQIEIPVKYSIEWPKEKDIVIRE